MAFVNFMLALGYLLLSCSCFASWFSSKGHFLGFVFLLVILFKVLPSFSDDIVKPMLVIGSIHGSCMLSR